MWVNSLFDQIHRASCLNCDTKWHVYGISCLTDVSEGVFALHFWQDFMNL